MKKITAVALGAALLMGGIAATAAAQEAAKARVDKGRIAFFEGNSFDRMTYEARGARPRIELEFNVTSIAVHPGEKWQVCAGLRYKEPCMVIDKDTTDLGGVAVQSARPVKE